MKKVLRCGGYILSFILVLSYFLILSTSLYPKVNTEYDLYYLSKDLQDWPGYGGLEYTLGKPESFARYDDNRIRRRGNSWNSFEDDGCWTYGDTASVLYTGIAEQNLILEVEIPDIREGAAAEVCVNGVSVGRIEHARTYSFGISQELVNGDITTVEFRIDNFGAIRDDARSQGIKLKEITIDADLSKD